MPTAASLPRRLGGVSIGRVVAAACVVGIHALAPARNLSLDVAILPTLVQPFLKWSLPFFVMVAGYLQGSTPKAGGSAWLKRRLIRLILPLLTWSVFFRILRYLDGTTMNYSLKTLFKDVLLGLAWSHLWFLPVLALCTVTVWLIDRWRVRMGIALWVSFALAGTYVVIASAVPLNGDEFPTVYLYRSPMFWLLFYLLGTVLARSGSDLRSTVSRLSPWFLVCGIGLTIVSLAPRLGLHVIDLHAAEALVLTGSALSGTALAVMALQPRLSLGASTEQFASLSMGIYLVHPLVQYAILLMLPLGFVRGAVDVSAVVIWVTMYVVSAIIAHILRETPVRSLVV